MAPAEADGLFNGLEEALDNKTQAILQARIAPTTRGNYFSMIVRLFCYLQDNDELYPGVLSPALTAALREADSQDSQKRTKRGAPSKRRDASKQVVINAIKSIDSHPSSFPINFDNFTFNCFAGFLKTFKKTIVKRSHQTPSAAQDEEVTTVVTSCVTIRLGAGSFSTACSVLAFIFTECGVEKDGTSLHDICGS